jgi:hypothetical protein
LKEGECITDSLATEAIVYNIGGNRSIRKIPLLERAVDLPLLAIKLLSWKL